MTGGWLSRLEKAGNRLPDPVVLFIYGIFLVVLLAELAVWLQWQVPGVGDDASIIRATSILSTDGLWWWLSHMVSNFVQFPPLGIVLVAMLGIGVAERAGLLDAVITTVQRGLPDQWLVPATLFLGIMSSFTLDAGYVVLPPIAAVLFARLGHSPITGLVVSFAGVSAGFGANLFITSLDPLLAGFTQSAAQLIDQDYRVAVTANWWFMIASTVVLTAVGTVVTKRWVADRAEQYPVAEQAMQLQPIGCLDRRQRLALWLAILVAGVLLVCIVYSVTTRGSVLYGVGEHFDRWIEVMVPLLFLLFLLPGWIYGRVSGSIKNSKDFASMLAATFSGLGHYIVLAFFASQFIALFKYTQLGEMIAITGGSWLAAMNLPILFLLFAFILLACLGNLLIGSMSAKYALLAPVFVPMLMLAGIPPELTQVAYRIGDSVTNVITPLNPYMVIILALLQKYYANAGLGTLVSLTLPYSIAFLLAWMVLLAVWLLLGISFGPGSPI